MRERKKLNTQRQFNRNYRTREVSDRDFEEGQDLNSSQDFNNHEEKRPVKKKKRRLFLINLVLSIMFIVFIFMMNIFYMPTRILISASLLFILILIYFIESSKKLYLAKFLGKIYMIAGSILILVFIPFFLYANFVLLSMNRENIPNGQVGDGRSYNLLVLGLDSEGDLESLSRSDVNILTTVNLQKDKVYMTSVPRDTYLPIAEGGQNQYDKLTHAGNYGAIASMKTLENAFESPINYYMKINFTSFINMIDALGGIEVTNDQAFTAYDGSYFPVGRVELTSSQALAFVRERYSLAGGDLARGNNQQKVILGIIDKIMSPSSIVNYPNILTKAKESVSTNLPANVIFNSLFEYLISGGLDIERLQVQGYDSYDLPSYAMPGYNLYMFVPYEESLMEISQKINELLR